MGATIATYIATGSRVRSFMTASALRTDLRRSALCAAVKRVIRDGRDNATNNATAAETRRLRRASILYGWHSDGAQATRDRPGREVLQGPGSALAQSRRDTLSSGTDSVQSSAASPRALGPEPLESEPLELEPWAACTWGGSVTAGRDRRVVC